MALVRGQVQAAQLRAQARDGAAEIRRVVRQEADQAARVAARQFILEPRPVAPVLAEQALLLLFGRAIVFIRRRQDLPQRLLVAPKPKLPGDEAGAAGDRAETLVVKVIGNAAGAYLLQGDGRGRDVGFLQAAQDQLKPIGADVLRAVRLLDLAEPGDLDALMVQVAARPMEDRQVLDRARMTVLEPAVGEPAQVELPAAANGGESVRRGPACLLQPIKAEHAPVAGSDVGHFLDLEVVGTLFDDESHWS